MNRPELNQQLKERFFATYHKQMVAYDSEWKELGLSPYMCLAELCQQRKSGVVPYLLLRSVSQLTDEEAIEVAKIFSDEYESVVDIIRNEESVVVLSDNRQMIIDKLGDIRQEYLLNNGTAGTYTLWEYDVLHCFDYLRSIGIALPFMGYSVEEFLEVGWIKLRPHETPVER